MGGGKGNLGDKLSVMPVSLVCGRRRATSCGLGGGEVMGRDAVGGVWMGGWSLVESAEQLGVAAGKKRDVTRQGGTHCRHQPTNAGLRRQGQGAWLS